jgi:hypothetical protein
MGRLRLVALSIVLVTFLAGLSAGYGLASAARVPAQPTPLGVRLFMDGLLNLDGHKTWAACSSDYRQKSVKDGGGEAFDVTFYDHLKQEGKHIDRAFVAGGYQLPDHGIWVFVTEQDTSDGVNRTIWAVITDDTELISMFL